MSRRDGRVRPRSRGAVGLLSCVVLLAAAAPATASHRASEREAAALDLLERAVRAARTVGWSGTQYVASWSAGTSSSTLAEMAHDPARGAVVMAGSSPSGAPVSRVVTSQGQLEDRLLEVLAAEYDLLVAGVDRCAGRTASVVEARRPGAVGAGAVAGRLWVDRETGLLLRREVYDTRGQRVRSAAFVELDVTRSAPVDPGTPGERATAMSVAASVPTSGTDPARDGAAPRGADLLRPARAAVLDALRTQGWQAPEQLPGGFALLDVREPAGPSGTSVLHLTYSDGLSSMSLFAQRGRLGSGPAGFAAASMGGAPVWVHAGAPSRVVWSGGDEVFTLVTDAPVEAVEAAVTALPRERATPEDDGLLARLGRGLSRLRDALPFR